MCYNYVVGYYYVDKLGNVPCLIYVTFNNKIILYYNIRLPHIGMTNLIDVTKEKPEFKQLLKALNIDSKIYFFHNY